MTIVVEKAGWKISGETPQEIAMGIAALSASLSGNPISHPKQPYPWDEWLDGNVHTIQRGRDFRPNIESFRTSIYNAARKREIPITTRASIKKGTLTIIPRQTHADNDDPQYPGTGDSQ